MKDLEEVNCEIRRTVNLQFPVSNWLRNLEYGQSMNFQEQNNIDYRGGFLHNATCAWLSYGCHLVVFNVKTGETISRWTFRGIITSISQFPAQSEEIPLLLVGIDNCASKLKDSSGLLCIFACSTSRVLRAIRMPYGVEQVCVVAGGAKWEEFNDKRQDNVLNEMDGIACVVLRNLQHIMIDLRRSTWDTHNFFVMDETSPAEIDFLSANQVIGRHHSNRERHAAYNLLNSRIEKYIGFNREDFELSSLLGDNLTTAIISSTKIGCLISGCLGRVIIWQNDGTIQWISTPVDENMTVTHLALLEPTDDPRPFYYLWVVFQDELSKAPPILRMYAMLFERKYCNREINLYFNLEDEPSLKFESELNEGDRIISLCTIERESNPEQTESTGRRGEDNLLLIATNVRVLLFDLNQWYKEQMPHTVSECQNPNSILATYRTRSNAHNEEDNQVISLAYVPYSLQEFLSNGPSPPEELFYPNSLSLEWVELNPTKLTFWMTRGIQADLLREIVTAGPVILIRPFETFHRCLSIGLVPFNSECSFASDQNVQREMLLSLCLEQLWSTFLVKCATEWSDGSASYLYPTFLKWGVQRASMIKMMADRLCIPLFDQSGSSIGETDVRTLRFCSQQLQCLSNVVDKLPSTTMDLTKQRRTLRRVSTYFQVLLWFYDVGLLPETQDLKEKEEDENENENEDDDEDEDENEDEDEDEDEDENENENENDGDNEEKKKKNMLSISLALRVPYPYEKLSMLYKEKRAQFSKDNDGNGENEEDLFIDELITRECPMLKAQWEREGSTITNGCYPPPSLQSLLRSFLTDCHHTETNEISCRHQITIYLLMDLAMLLHPALYPAVKQLIKYPSAFMMSPSLIKLTQAFWLLDHENYQNFLDTIIGQLICDSDIKDWHHKLILRTLVRNNQHKLALVYLRVRKPPLSSMEEQGMAMSLSVEYGLVQSAFHRRPPCHYEQLLTNFFRACKKYDRLDEVLHLVLDSEEEEVFIKFLEENKMEDLRLLYYLQRCRYTEAIGSHPIRQYQSNFVKDVQSMSLNSQMLSAYEMTLPDVTKRFSTNAAAINSDTDLKERYPRPMSHCKSHDKLRTIYETVITKARETYQRGEKGQIPFVSAPCTSLRLNNYGANVNCVLFPSLMRKSRGKRMIDQIYEEDEDNADDTLDNIKRRKLSDGNISSSKRASEESGLMATFETPLVKRKLDTSMNKDRILETPQSILKIRQLVKSSTSSDITTSQTKGDRLLEKERRVNRQIRFNINQSKKVLVNEEEERDVEKKEEEEEEKREEEDDNEIDAPNASNDGFISSNVNSKSYYEDTVLSDSSNTFSKIYARPRPSLRTSVLQSSVEMSQEGAKKAIDSSTNLFAITSSTSKETNKSSNFTPNISRNRDSLLSASIYSPAVLSSDSSVDINYSKKAERTSPLQWRLSTKRDSNDKFIISSTPLTKIVVSKFINKSINKQAIKVDDVSNVYKTEEDLNVLSTLSESKGSVHIEPSASSESDLAEQGNLKKNVESERQDKYNNGRIARNESPSLQNYGSPIASENVGSSSTVSEEFDEELFQLRDEEDNNEQEEVFESLSTILEDTQMCLDSQIFSASRLSREMWDPELCQTDGYNVTKPNGLQESVQMNDIVLTDDESASSRTVTPLISDETDNNKRKRHSVDSEHILYDMPNITDDESDSSTRETEETKAKNGRYSNLQGYYVTRNIKVEKNCESNETRRKSEIGRDSISKKDLENGLQPQSDVDIENEWKKIFSSYVRLTKIESNSIETSKGATEEIAERKLSEVQNNSENKTNEVEATDVSFVRTRLRRASSMMKETTSSPSERLRDRRAKSLAKDIISLMSSVDKSFESKSAVESCNAQSLARRRRDRSSVTKEISQVEMKDSDSESVKEELPQVRRSTRLASSVRKELQADAPIERSFARSKSVSSLTKLTSDDEEGGNINKKSQRRVRKFSMSSDADATISSRSLRSSKERSKERDVTMTRRRGSSVPKEITAQPILSRRRRSSSIIKEVIPEAVESQEEQKRLEKKTFVVKNTEEVVSRLTNARNRSASMLSIPEELEEILSPPLRETRSTRRKAAQSDMRDRRASSADVMYTEMKRRVRNVNARNITVEPAIAEESMENEVRVKLERDKTVDSQEIAQNAPTSKSATTINKTKKEPVKRKRDRSHKTNVNQETSNLFSFSLPEETNDVPSEKDIADIGEVPNYVFSPPQTRSENISQNQYRRKVSSFIPSYYQRGKQQFTTSKPHGIVKSGRYARLIVNTFGSQFRTRFVVSKKSKSTTN